MKEVEEIVEGIVWSFPNVSAVTSEIQHWRFIEVYKLNILNWTQVTVTIYVKTHSELDSI